MKKIIALVLALVMTLSLLPMTAWATTAFSYNDVEFYTEYDSTSGTFVSEGMSTTINGGGGTSVLVPYASGLTSASVYLKPASGTTLKLNDWHTSFGSLSAADGNGVYELTQNDFTKNALVLIYNGETKIGEIDILFSEQGGNQGGNQPSGETFSPKGIYIFTGMEGGIPNYDGSLSEAGGIVTIPSGSSGRRIFVATEEDLVKGNSWPSSVEVNPANPSTWSGRKLYEMIVTGQDSGKVDATITGIGNGGAETLTFRFDFDPQNGGGQNNYPPMFVYNKDQDKYFGGAGFSVGGMQELQLYLGTYDQETNSWGDYEQVSKNNGVTFECSGADYNYTNCFSWSTETGKENVLLFDTRNISLNEETQVQLLMTKGSETFRLDLFLHPGGNQGGGSNEQRIEYITKSGDSKIVVNVFEGVEEVIEFPQPGKLTSDTLTFTVKTADPDKWRPLLNRGNDAFWIPYNIVPINSPEGAVGAPKIAFAMGDGNLAGVEQSLKDNIGKATFYAYNAFPPAQNDSAQYAWDSSSSGGVVTIIPKTQEVSRAWCWRYSGADEAFSAPDQFDGVTVKVALGEGISDVISVKEIAYPAVEANRIFLVGPEEINKVLAFDEYKNSVFTYKDGQEGVLTYTYVGTDTSMSATDAIYAAAKKHNITPDGSNVLHYDLLKVTAPAGYVAKEVKCSYYTQDGGFNNNGSEVILRYHWRGLYDDLTFAVTWTDANTSDATVLEDKVEQVTIVMPNTEKKGPWMAYPVINGVEQTATPVAKERLVFTALDGVQGVTEHKYNEATGVLFTTYNNQDIVDVSPILDATYSIKAPEGAISFNVLMGGDGTDDPTYNISSEWKAQFFWENAVNGRVFSVSDSAIENVSIIALLKQTYGEDNGIEYYYSADEGTRYILLRWNFENSEPLYEYLQLDTSNYFCQWKTAAVPTTSTDKKPVSKPTVVFDDEELELVTELVPQEMEGQYYYKMHLLKEGKVVTDYKGPYRIILPYCFMGRDEHGKDIWDWSKASKFKNDPVINHYDDLHKQTEQITGKYTERGIEFEVSSFSPFMLTWDETEDSTGGGSNGSYPGGYYPVVTPDKNTTTETKPTTPAQPTTPPAEETVTPEPEDTTPVVPDEPIVDDPVVDVPADDTEQSSGSGAGLWIGIGIVALAAIVVVLAIMAARKKRK